MVLYVRICEAAQIGWVVDSRLTLYPLAIQGNHVHLHTLTRASTLSLTRLVGWSRLAFDHDRTEYPGPGIGHRGAVVRDPQLTPPQRKIGLSVFSLYDASLAS